MKISVVPDKADESEKFCLKNAWPDANDTHNSRNEVTGLKDICMVLAQG